MEFVAQYSKSSVGTEKLRFRLAIGLKIGKMGENAFTSRQMRSESRGITNVSSRCALKKVQHDVGFTRVGHQIV